MCDTFVAMPDATAGGAVIFGKNSDRPADEAQSVVRFPRAQHPEGARLRCTYIEIPQVAETHAVLLSQPDWMWGAEMGANEHDVVIGNEAIFVAGPLEDEALLGMDLVRLGLERARSAREAVLVIAGLLESHGQGGACAEGDPGFSYHNSFLIADPADAWVLETVGRLWAAEQVQRGTRNISNQLSIRSRFELSSAQLPEAASFLGLYDGQGSFDFALVFGDADSLRDESCRAAWGSRLLAAEHGRVDSRCMMRILADHPSGICMHGGFATTASMVSELRPGASQHWLTGRAHPCQSPFEPYPLHQDA